MFSIEIFQSVFHELKSGTVKVLDEGIENNLQRKLMNAPCLQSKDVNWIEVRPNFHSRNLSFCFGLHNCRPFCCTFFQYKLQRASPSNALPWLKYMSEMPYQYYLEQRNFFMNYRRKAFLIALIRIWLMKNQHSKWKKSWTKGI
jgi:hypothetical protein